MTPFNITYIIYSFLYFSSFFCYFEQTGITFSGSKLQTRQQFNKKFETIKTQTEDEISLLISVLKSLHSALSELQIDREVKVSVAYSLSSFSKFRKSSKSFLSKIVFYLVNYSGRVERK